VRAALFGELGDLNDRLEKLVQKQEKLVQLQEERNSERQLAVSLLGPKANSFWRYADQLYKSLAVAWQCNCFQHHCAKLMLQHRQTLDIEFMLVFQFQSNNSSLGAPSQVWQLQETSVKGREDKQSIVQIQTTSNVTIPNHRTAAPLRGALRLPGGKRRARISIASSAKYATTHLLVINTDPS
jgi:hypothetical protein